MFGLSEIAIILIVVILVLGAKKLPELARSAGKSARILKAEAKAMQKEDQATAEAQQTPPQVFEGQVLLPDSSTSPPTSADASHSPGRPGTDTRR
ncbi:Sec-independent protein translocase subunit TatA [Streptomyces sp. NPDC003032]